MALTYTVLETKDGVAQVEFLDSESSLKQTKTINIGDLTTPEEITERYEQHMNSFKHRLSIGLIKPYTPPLNETIDAAPAVDKKTK